MATASELGKAGFKPERIDTKATVHLTSVSGGFAITRIDLDTEADVPGIDEAKFLQIAQGAKANCIVSKALAAVPEITLNARLRQKTA
jgi:osmotically inducible protein OsmC